MLEFIKSETHLILSYVQDIDPQENWVIKELEEKRSVTLKRTFHFSVDDEFVHPTSDTETGDSDLDFDPEAVYFVLANKTDRYYKIKRGVLTDRYDIFIHEDIDVDDSLFIADANISIFKVLQSLVTTDVYLGGDHPTAIPENGFLELIKSFPGAYEKKMYVEARVSAVLREYFEGLKDGEAAYHRYMNKKFQRTSDGLKKTFQEAELFKYQTILQKLEQMLGEEHGYSEKQWQEEILQILLLIYPKYIYVFREVPIKDKNIQERFLDYLLVDSSGYTDIVEIKRPFGKCILTENKYRNNYIPLRELSGTIMQIEKYIFYMNRWGFEGEEYLSEKYARELPEGFQIKITNPSGVIIMGREHNLSTDQKADFEVVKRKYKNVVDIITYDNLIHRLKSTIDQIQKL